MDFNHNQFITLRTGGGKVASLWISVAVAFCLLLSCFSQTSNPQKLPARELTITTAAGSKISLQTELAMNDRDRTQGYMNRTHIPDGEGMLFVFNRDQILSFWMKNTLVPLSIAFISSDGMIREIKHMEARSLTPVKSERSVRYALEVPEGWFSRAGVAPGDMLELPASLQKNVQ